MQIDEIKGEKRKYIFNWTVFWRMCSQYIVTQRAVNCLDFPTGDHSFADIYIVIFQNNMRLTAFNGGKAFKSRGNSIRQKRLDEFMWSN